MSQFVKSTDAENVDLDITDLEGNVVLRLSDGHVKTKNFDSACMSDPFNVPEYYFENNYLQNKCNRINQIASSCNGQMDSFCFFTDLHWHLNAGKTPALLKYVKENTRIDKFFCGGDVCDYITSEHQPYDAWTQFKNALQMPIYMTMGNHDYMSEYATEGRLYYTFNSVGRDRIGNLNRNYYYLDNPQSKIRYIFLNGFKPENNTWDWGLEQEQLVWLVDHALCLGSGWDAIIITHMILGIDLDSLNLYMPTMATNLLTVLDSCPGNNKIIAIICGHTHFDYLAYTDSDIPILITTSDKYLPWISSGINKEPFLSDRIKDTITEQAIDNYIVDKNAMTLTRVRIGCPIHYGINSSTWVPYEEVVISYAREAKKKGDDYG